MTIRVGDMVRTIIGCRCGYGVGAIGLVLNVEPVKNGFLECRNCGLIFASPSSLVAHCTFNTNGSVVPTSWLKRIDPPDFALPAPPRALEKEKQPWHTPTLI